MSRTNAKSSAVAPSGDQKRTGSSASTGSPNGNNDTKKGPCFKVGPIATDASGHSVEACVWDKDLTASDGREFTVYSVSCQASYRDDKGDWQKTSSFRSSQIPVLVYCLNKCFDWVQAQRERLQESSDAA